MDKTIFICSKCEYAENSEISKLKDGDQCPTCGGTVQEHKSIEVGNIFPLGTKYSEAFNLKYTDEKGEKKLVVMGSYGWGPSRVMGTVVEIHHDDKGIVWPESIAPYQVHLIALDENAKKEADKIYKELRDKGVEVLYDDRMDKSAGEKFTDADLLGVPIRAVVSKKTMEQDGIEVKRRNEADSRVIHLSNFFELL